jgi:DNA polymerase-3 subunit delta
MAKRANSSKTGASGLPLGPDSRIVLLTGKEHFLRSGYTDQLREMLNESQGGEVEVVRFAGDSTPAAEVLDECRSFGLMVTHKMVVVDEADRLINESSRPAFERYAEQPAETATLVLRAEKWHKGKLDKLIEKCGTIIKCDQIAPERAVSWCGGRAKKQHGAIMQPRAAQLLVERVGPDLGRLASEIDKLASAASSEGTDPITIIEDHVREFVGLSREEQVWTIQEVLLTGRADAAIAMLHELVEISRVSEVLIRFAYVDLARKLHGYARGMASGVPAQQLNKSLKLWGASANSVARAAQTASPAALARLFDEAVEADFRGKTSQGDAILALETLSVRFAQVLRPRR